MLHLFNNFLQNIEIKRHSQLSPLFCLFTWGKQTYDYMGTDREPSVYTPAFILRHSTAIAGV